MFMFQPRCKAPVAEELMFRACMLPFLVPNFGEDLAIKVCPLFFSVGEWSRHRAVLQWLPVPMLFHSATINKIAIFAAINNSYFSYHYIILLLATIVSIVTTMILVIAVAMVTIVDIVTIVILVTMTSMVATPYCGCHCIFYTYFLVLILVLSFCCMVTTLF